MPLPLSINLRVAYYLATRRGRALRRAETSSGPPAVPLVLMLELTHACNLRCAGCGRVREYSDGLDQRLTPAQARGAMLEAGTPFVSISGGEPLMHPEAPAIVAEALGLGKVVYLCTNGLLLQKRLAELRPHRRLYLNVHLDGTAAVHDRLTGLPGCAERALQGIAAARAAGFNVTTNTTLYKDTPVADVAQLFERLVALGVSGFMVAPAFAYEVGTPASTLTREEAQERFRQLRALWGDRNFYHTPAYMQFLRGERQLDCVPWGTVTYGPQGWKQPCYLLNDGHVPSLEQLLRETDWSHLGPGRDERCANCMLHSGFEPSVMSSLHGLRDWWELLRWQFGWQERPRGKLRPEGGK